MGRRSATKCLVVDVAADAPDSSRNLAEQALSGMRSGSVRSESGPNSACAPYSLTATSASRGSIDRHPRKVAPGSVNRLVVGNGIRINCYQRSRWFELDCLVEQAEFELRCGLKGRAAPVPGQPRHLCEVVNGVEAAQSRTLRLSFIPGVTPNRRRCSFQSQDNCFMTCGSVSCAD